MSHNTNNFSKEGFQRLNPGESTVSIPMDRVPSPAVSYQAPSPMNEKQGLFQRPVSNGFRRSIKPGMPAQSAQVKAGAAHHDDHEEEDVLTRMGSFYQKFTSFSVMTRYIVYVVPVGLLLSIPIIVTALLFPTYKATPENHKEPWKGPMIGGVPVQWFFTWLLITWCGLWISKTTAHYLPHIFQFFCGVISPGVRKYAQVIGALEIPLSLVGWALISLATFRPVTSKLDDDAPLPWVSIVERILAASLIGTIVFLTERVFIQLISINYHRKQLHFRIRDSKHSIFLLSLLYDASRAMFPSFCPEFSDEDAAISDSINLSKKKGGHRKSGMATPMQLVQNVGRFGDKMGDKITSAFGNVTHEITGKDVFNSDSAHSVVIQALEKNKSAEALARRIWLSFVVEGNDALYMDDVVEVLGAGRQPEAEACFGTLDRDGNGDVSLDEMILTVTEFGRERHAIANSMHDVDQAIKVLDRMLCVVVLVACVLILVSFLVTSFYTTLATTGTALLSLSFVFSSTAQEILGSCIFLFVKHPYDIGDRVEVSEENLVVEHISLLFSVFRKISSNQLVQVPHVLLNTLWINNITRSKAMREQLSVYIDFDTTFEDIQLLRSEMTKFVLDPAHSRDFFPDIDIQVLGFDKMDKMELRIDIMHKSNWANEAVRAARRSKFMCALVLALRRVPINAPGGGGASLGEAANPTYSVAISPSAADNIKADAATAAEAARLVPTKKDNVADKRKTAQSEQQAVNALTERNTAVDKTRDASEDLKDRNKQETAELEEVRGILRKETLKGRRKSQHHRSLQSQASMKSTKSQREARRVETERNAPPTPDPIAALNRTQSSGANRARSPSNEDDEVKALPRLPAMNYGGPPGAGLGPRR